MYIKAARSKNERDEAIFHAIARYCWLYFHVTICSDLELLIATNRRFWQIQYNATAIGPSLPKVKISRSQSFASNPTQDGVVLFSSYFFSFFLIFVLLNWPRGVLEFFFKTALVNCIYLTSEKSNAESKSGLIGTLLASCHAVQDIEW